MFDVIVIGGGPGGYAAAIRSAQLGKKVAVIETAQIGGTCVNRGCIPAKVWHHVATLLQSIKGANKFGLEVSAPEIDVKVVADRANATSNYIRMGMEGLLKGRKVELVKGQATVKSPAEVNVNGSVLETRKIILATGSDLQPPAVPGIAEAVWTSDQMLQMPAIPGTVLIWGTANLIEVEMASLLSALGCKVTLAFESRRILPKEDGDTSQRIAQALREQGVEIMSQVTLASVTPSKLGSLCVLSGAQERRTDVEKVLITSRRPRSSHLGLENMGVEIGEDGGILINERLETSVKGIFAVGDVTGGWMLSHAASSMAIVAAENATGSHKKFPFHLVPRGMWTIPEMGAVGLSEEEAEQKGIEVEVGDFPYAINGLALARGQMKGAAKIITNARNGAIVGVHIVGDGATELIGEAVMAMQLGARAKDYADSIRVHPTFSEALIESGRDVDNWALYLPVR